MNEFSARDAIRMFGALSDRMSTARDDLCRLDGVIGDGDHGIAVESGFRAASEAAAGLGPDATLADVFTAAADGFLDAVGASSGPLYATAFMRAGKAAGARAVMPLADAPNLLAAMAEGIAARGKAAPGDKTMVDVWSPVAATAMASSSEGLAERLDRIVGAARSGAEATRAMVARKGRAARLGDRSVGHVDPGAASASLIVETMATHWRALAAAGASSSVASVGESP